MELDHRGQQTGSHRTPEVPWQRVDSPSMPMRVPSTRARHAAWSKPPKERKPRRWGLLLIPLAIIAVVGAGMYFWFTIPGSIDNAHAGDCAKYDRSDAQTPYATVRCGSAAASFTVLRVIEGEGSCRQVAGATRSTISTESNVRREICLGPKDVDPASAINAAQVGDCLTGTTGQERRVPCTDPAATVKILERVNDVSNVQVSTTCDRVPGATSVYSWTWDTDDGTGPAQASYQTDAVFCLKPIR